MIYFIQSKQTIKIGVALDPKKRLLELQTGNPYKLKLLATIEGSFQTELGLHEAFAKYRLHGEWFRFDGELKRCLLVLTGSDVGNSTKPEDIKTIPQLLKAGQDLAIRQKMNRYEPFKKEVQQRYL